MHLAIERIQDISTVITFFIGVGRGLAVAVIADSNMVVLETLRAGRVVASSLKRDLPN